MKLDLSQFSIEELRDINKQSRCVRRLSNKFQLGDKVEFDLELGLIRGIIIRLNRKTVTILETVAQRKWRVSPTLLRKI